MTSMPSPGGTPSLDDLDRALLRLLQRDASRSLERIAVDVGLSKSAVWNRIQRLIQSGVILRQAMILDPARIGLGETFFVSIRTAQHNDDWLRRFQAAIGAMPEVTEAHRLAGTLDYLLKVQTTSTAAFDDFYKRLVAQIDLFDVSSSLSMEAIKAPGPLPV